MDEGTVLATAAGLSLLAWITLLIHPARPWDFQPVGEDGKPPAAPGEGWPAVRALIPARNEAALLPRTLPALLTQDYPGSLQVILVDDRSEDGTGEAAGRLAGEAGFPDRLRVIEGTDPPSGWVGKVWALEQGARAALGEPGAADIAFFLLTDADILHTTGSLSRLVAESRYAGLALNSRLARLNCESAWEHLLIPAFVFFFNLLYPMRRVNRPDDPTAAAAGGCILLDRRAYEGIGGFGCLRGALIDDVTLARRVKEKGWPIRLSLSRSDLVSLRRYGTLGSIWSMVRRTAFTELRYSWVRLAGTMAGLTLIFLVPVLAAAVGLAAGHPPGLLFLGGILGVLSWGLMGATYRPAVRFYGLSGLYALSLPLSALLYLGMTLDSALRHATGLRTSWRGRSVQTYTKSG